MHCLPVYALYPDSIFGTKYKRYHYYGILRYSLLFVKSSIAMGNLSHVLLLHVKITHKVWKPFLKRFIAFLFIFIEALNWLGRDLGILNFGLQIYFDRPYPSFGHTQFLFLFDGCWMVLLLIQRNIRIGCIPWRTSVWIMNYWMNNKFESAFNAMRLRAVMWFIS